MNTANVFGTGGYVEREYPELSWSLSRDRAMNSCLFKYYTKYYKTHNGWKKGCAPDRRKAYVLNKLSGVYLLFGDLLHKAAESTISSYRTAKTFPRVEVLHNGIKTLMNKALTDSLKHRQLWELNPKQYTMLSEIYYDGEIPQKTIDVIKERRHKCVENFMGSDTLLEMKYYDLQYLEVERWSANEILGIKNHLKIDLLYRLGDEKTGIYKIKDWKTGSENDEESFDQLCSYALYVSQRYNVEVERIEIGIEYLLTGEHKTHEVRQADIDYIKNKITSSIDTMKSLCEDPQKNIPKDESLFCGSVSNMCKFCSFREVCPAYIKS